MPKKTKSALCGVILSSGSPCRNKSEFGPCHKHKGATRKKGQAKVCGAPLKSGGHCKRQAGLYHHCAGHNAAMADAMLPDPFVGGDQRPGPTGGTGSVRLDRDRAYEPGDRFYDSALQLETMTTACTVDGCNGTTTNRRGTCDPCHADKRAPGPENSRYDKLRASQIAVTACQADTGEGVCGQPTRSRTACGEHRPGGGGGGLARKTDPPQRSAAHELDLFRSQLDVFDVGGGGTLADLVGTAAPQLGLAKRGSDQHAKDVKTRGVEAWCTGGGHDADCPNSTKSTTGRCGAHRPEGFGVQCIAITNAGKRCKKSVWGNSTCSAHTGSDRTLLTVDPHLCTSTTHAGTRCTKPVQEGSARCYLHANSKPAPPRSGGTHSGTSTKGTPPKPAGKGDRKYGHSNDAVVGPEAAKRNLPRVEHLRGKKVVFVDMDGTVYDSWASIGKRDNSLVGTPEHRHIRHDTVDKIKEVCEANPNDDGSPAIPVALSWRGGCEGVTREWLGYLEADTGLRIADVFVPGSSQDIAGLTMPRTKDGRMDHQANRSKWKGGQVAYKAHTISALLEVLEVQPVGHFEDNPDVLEMSASFGTPNTHHVKRLVEIADHEWTAGYLGAPKPKAGSWGTRKCEVCNNQFDDVNCRPDKRDRLRCTDCVASVGTWQEEQDRKRAERAAKHGNASGGSAGELLDWMGGGPSTDAFDHFGPASDDYSAGNTCAGCHSPVGGPPDPHALCGDCNALVLTGDGTPIEDGVELYLFEDSGPLSEVEVLMADDGAQAVVVKRRSDGETLFVDAEDLYSTPF